jgi:CRP-like cAMP-binding protein
MDIDEIIDYVYRLPAASCRQLKACLREVCFPKGHILLRADRVERFVYFIKKGIVRAYSDHDGQQITFWIGTEGATVVSLKSYVSNERGYENLELLEDSELYELKMAELQQLFETDIHIANWGRKFAELELIRAEERMISRQLGTAAERYRKFMSQSPDLLQRVPLGYIASYLGITQVSLSRIRAEIR